MRTTLGLMSRCPGVFSGDPASQTSVDMPAWSLAWAGGVAEGAAFAAGAASRVVWRRKWLSLKVLLLLLLLLLLLPWQKTVLRKKVLRKTALSLKLKVLPAV